MPPIRVSTKAGLCGVDDYAECRNASVLTTWFNRGQGDDGVG